LTTSPPIRTRAQQRHPAHQSSGSVPSIADVPISDANIFDNKGNLTSTTRTVSGTPAFASSYTYDLVGNVTSATYPSGRIVSFARDILGRITGIATNQSAGAPSQTVASSVGWIPYSGVSSLTFGNGVVETFSRDTDDRITGVVAQTASSANVVNRTLAWTGETLDSITDNQFPGNTPPFTYTAQSQAFTYTPTHRLASAIGYYGSYAWAYDPTGNRTSETANSVASAYAYPSTSNQLASVTPSGGTARSFAYDAAGDITSDSASVGGAGPALTYEYDAEARLAAAAQTAAPGNGATYAYDSDSRLSARTVTTASPPSSTTILYAYDTNDHIIAELNTAGQTLREYIWLNDMPVAVVDNVATTPVIYYVQTDHLMRPARMTDGATNWVWDVIFTPFGATAYINQNPTVMDIRFPGQWFQLETGLAYNWHRHYDATLGRYVQPDRVFIQGDRGLRTGFKLSDGVSADRGAHLAHYLRSVPLLHSVTSQIVSSDVSASENSTAQLDVLTNGNSPPDTLFPDGPSIYGYAKQTPLTKSDQKGLQTGPFTLLPAQSSVCLASVTRFCPLVSSNFVFEAVGEVPVTFCDYDCSDPGAANDNYVTKRFLGIVKCKSGFPG
jgi:RHS repeat-associated protein